MGKYTILRQLLVEYAKRISVRREQSCFYPCAAPSSRSCREISSGQAMLSVLHPSVPRNYQRYQSDPCVCNIQLRTHAVMLNFPQSSFQLRPSSPSMPRTNVVSRTRDKSSCIAPIVLSRKRCTYFDLRLTHIYIYIYVFYMI